MPDQGKTDKPKKSGWLRKVLIGLFVVLLALGGVIAWLFLFPAKPPLTAGTSINCEAVALCSQACAKQCPSGLRKLPCMSDCTKRCAERGCEGARPPYLDMIRCVRGNCLMKCISGPGSACEECSARECADQRAACFAQVCPEQ